MKLLLHISSAAALATAALAVGPFLVPAGATPDAGLPRLQSRLLTSPELPGGWRVQRIPSNGIGCLANLIEPKGITVTRSAEISFAATPGLPQIVERVATYRDAAAAYRGIVARLTACTHVTGEIDGTRLTGTLTPIAGSQDGTTRATFAATFAATGAQLADDVAIVRRGRIIMGIDEGGYAPIDVNQFQTTVSVAARKLS